MSPENETTHAVLDRIVDDTHAVLLVGDEEAEFVIEVERLPEGVSAGDWLQVTVTDGAVTDIELDPNATEAARMRIDAKLDRLRARGRRPDRETPGGTAKPVE